MGDVSFSSRSACELRVEPGLESLCLGFFEGADVGGGKSHCRFPFLQPVRHCQSITQKCVYSQEVLTFTNRPSLIAL